MRNKEILWFRLFNANGFGSKSIHYMFDILQRKHQTVEDLYALDEKEFAQTFPEIGHGKFSKASFWSVHQTENDSRVSASFEALEDERIRVIGLDDERYPKEVINTLNGNSPIVLFCRGNLKLLNNKGISIVGARDVDNFVVMLTKEIAKSLAHEGYNVTSGYAKGVDTSAHIGALEAEGTTTMILSFGVNHISIKREMKELDWEKNGLFVTQFAPYEKFTGQNAMARNKLVCAMSKAVVVMQSGPERDSEGKMSGTFDAGKSALELGIPVFVLSPKIVPHARGNQDLIRRGGVEFENGKQIIEYLEKVESTNVTNGSQAENGSIHKQGSSFASQLSLF
jgi:DNA processing protein